ncbi:hypothetical protein C1H46_025666 [Malus baccata]|uniref:Flavanone 4-reductase n=1 Tax=Malus baccata TaxID=106549 RepID=A0A540LQL3_MALBA|nr:hypothetical protein C1H46_025666 [Malus baccata]
MGSKSESVCVTGASSFIGSWLVMRLLERGYTFRATVRDATNQKKVKHLLDLPKAETRLTLWKADLAGEGSFDEAIQGCTGVFHVATPMDFDSTDPENRYYGRAQKAGLRRIQLEQLEFCRSIKMTGWKLTDIGFEFKYSLEDMFVEAVDTCQAKGLIPIPAEKTEAADESNVVDVKIAG